MARLASMGSTPWPSTKLVHTGTLAFLRPRERNPAVCVLGSVSLRAASTISAKDFGYCTPFAANSSLFQ
jgi:hypothetical protein